MNAEINDKADKTAEKMAAIRTKREAVKKGSAPQPAPKATSTKTEQVTHTPEKKEETTAGNKFDGDYGKLVDAYHTAYQQAGDAVKNGDEVARTTALVSQVKVELKLRDYETKNHLSLNAVLSALIIRRLQMTS